MREKKLFILVISVAIVAAALMGTAFFFYEHEEEKRVERDLIGVIDIRGTLLAGEEASFATTTGELERSLEKASRNSSIKGVILRVDSPGGSATASFEMYSMIKRFEKPIVAYGRGMMASGSYLASLGTDEILANPFSDVGSVGVYMKLEKPVPVEPENAEELEIISSGKFKTLWEDGVLDKEERAFLNQKAESIENAFRDIVYEESSIDKADVERNLENDIMNPFYVFREGGWFTGEEAKELGLIDELGDFENSVKIASELVGLKREEVQLVEIEPPEPGAFEDTFFGSKLY